MTSEISASGRRLVIVIPDGVEAARKLAERYPTLQIVVGDAASDAQRDLGLGAKFGMQRSGVLIVDSSAVPVYEHAATVPLFALNKRRRHSAHFVSRGRQRRGVPAAGVVRVRHPVRSEVSAIALLR